MRVLTSPETALSPELRRQVASLEHQAWPSIDPRLGHLHDPALEPLSMLLVDGDRVVAALAVLSKALAHRGRTYAARGLSTVVTDRSLRRRGHGLALVTAARELIAASRADLGLFTCDPPLQGFYERAGWEELPDAVVVGGTPEAPLASDTLGKVTLAGFFSPQAR
ncbi:MAG TPA: GNAT family N-acetyltransferase, partial [Acidimicrobiia bacterium]|nr:GNAT family N-acetyltransferase [Acidimicrobiia bacterium]